MSFKDKIVSFGGSVVENTKEHSTMILTILTGVGIIGTIVSALKTGPEVSELKKTRDADVNDILEDTEISVEEKSIEIKKANTEYRKDVFFVMLPTILIGGATLTFDILAEVINHKKIEGLKLELKDMAVAYAILEKKDLKFREKAKELIGQGKVDKIDTEVKRDEAKEALEGKIHVEPHNTGKGTTWFYDIGSGMVFLASEQAIYDAKNTFNSTLITSGCYDLDAKEFYYYLGLPEPKLAESKVYSPDHLLDYNITIGPVYFNGESHNMHILELIGEKRPQFMDSLL